MTKEEKLFKAAEEGDFKLAKSILNPKLMGLIKPVDPNITTDDGWTPLMAAAGNGRADVAALLIEKGALVDAKTPLGFTAFMSAAKFGHLDMARMLVEKGADPHAVKTGEDQGWNAILYASWQGHADVVKWLLENGADANTKSHDGWTPLLFAAREGHTDVVKLLLRNNADINATQKDGWTSLILAAFNGYDKIIGLLLGKKADIHVIAQDNQNALETAIDKDFGQIACTLLERGAQPDRPQPDGVPLLVKAVDKGLVNLTSAMLKTGKIDVNVTDKNGVTALMKAVQKNNSNAVSLLLDYKADVNLKDKQGATALDLASKKKRSKVRALLEEAGANHGKKQIPAAKGKGLPKLSEDLLDLNLTDSSQLVPSGNGGSSFQDAIQALNTKNDNMARLHFENALDDGLDSLREGYAHANLGSICIRKGDIRGAIDHFMKVIDLRTVLYESAHEAAQFLHIIYNEFGRWDEASALLNLSSMTQSHLGYSLDPGVAKKVKQAVKKYKDILLEKAAKPVKKTKPKKTAKKDLKKSLRPLGNRKRLTHTDDESAHDAYLLLFRDQDTMDRYYRCFLDFAGKIPPPVVMEVMTTHAPKTIFDEKYAFIYPHPLTDRREAYGEWLREAILTCNDHVRSHNHTSSRYNAIKTNVEKVYHWEILLPAAFDTALPENAEYLTDPPDGGYPEI